MELFGKYGVFTPREMHSRFEIALEQYAMSIGVEARLTLEIATTVVLPAALRYQTELAANLATLSAVGIDGDRSTLEEVSSALTSLRSGIALLRSELAQEGLDSTEKEAEHAGRTLLGDDGSGARIGRRARGHRGRRPVAAGDLPGDAVHPLSR